MPKLKTRLDRMGRELKEGGIAFNEHGAGVIIKLTPEKIRTLRLPKLGIEPPPPGERRAYRYRSHGDIKWDFEVAAMPEFVHEILDVNANMIAIKYTDTSPSGSGYVTIAEFYDEMRTIIGKLYGV